jgi:HEAT repeat protein
MSEDRGSNPSPAPNTPPEWEVPEEKTGPVTLLAQLVFIPLAVVVFCIGLGALFMWLTSERKEFEDYVRALRASRGARREQQAQYLLHYIQESKRWQGIFDVTAQMAGQITNEAARAEYLTRNPQTATGLIQVFEECRDGKDPKTRRYLALVLGMLGDPQVVPVLRRALDDRDAETVKNVIWALAWLRDREAIGKIIQLAGHEEVSVRLVAVYALGELASPQGRAVLIGALNDRDELVKWNAAFALARQGDPAGQDVLASLLDKSYVDRQTQVTAGNRTKLRVAALLMLVKLDAAGARPLLETVAAQDADLRVRSVALEQLEALNRQ